MVEQVIIIGGEEISVRAKSKAGLKCKKAATTVMVPFIVGGKIVGTMCKKVADKQEKR